MRIDRPAVLSAILLVAAAAPARGDVVPAGILGDHMVVQRDLPVKIWGTASNGESITVTLADRKAATRADDRGQWQVSLEPLTAGGPHQLTIAGGNTITFNDVLVGEVWICSGQSNMAWPVMRAMNAQNEIKEADYPRIRLLSIPRGPADEPRSNIEARWQICSPDTVGAFSAVGYFFGRELHKAVNVPVGLIDSSVGGTPAEAWTPRAVLEAEPDFAPIFESWQKRIAQAAAEEKNQAGGRPRDQRRAASAPAARRGVDPRKSPQRPTVLYNAMIHPLIPYTIRGAVWYQGESNAGRAYQYRKLFPAMIQSWRDAWRQGDFPFLFVQLANFQSSQKEPFASAWAELREAQTMTLSLPNTGMAVITDIGDPKDIHPANKQEVGRRLALAARAMVHGEKIPFSGPLYESMAVEGDAVRIRFKHVDGGLEAAGGGPLNGFAIAGEDRTFVEAQAAIDGDTVVVRSGKVARPAAVRYAWADAPPCSLFNKAGLPASPFRTDDWPGLTISEK